MRRFYLNDAVPGDLIEDVYILSGKQFAPTQNGKHYIKTFVSDRSAQVTARMWSATRDNFTQMPDGGFLRIRARIENYQNNLQCIIEQFWPAKNGTFEICDLLPQTDKNIDQMFARISAILGTIRNRHLAALIAAFVDDEKLMSNFRQAPAAMSFHHAYIGGLLEHTLNAVEVADAIVRFYPGLNRDLVVAGIFLHDIAKTWELTYECAFGYTDGGQLIGHIVKAAMWVEHKRSAAEARLGEQIPQPIIDVIQHIILSHHGSPEFGAVKVPATPEALAVHAIENMDAKLMMSLSATRGAASENKSAGEGNWTEYMKAFGGRMYRPDVAPPDEADETSPPFEDYTERSNGASLPSLPSNDPPPARLTITNPLFESIPQKRP